MWTYELEVNDGRGKGRKRKGENGGRGGIVNGYLGTANTHARALTMRELDTAVFYPKSNVYFFAARRGVG